MSIRVLNKVADIFMFGKSGIHQYIIREMIIVLIVVRLLTFVCDYK